MADAKYAKYHAWFRDRQHAEQMRDRIEKMSNEELLRLLEADTYFDVGGGWSVENEVAKRFRALLKV